MAWQRSLFKGGVVPYTVMVLDADTLGTARLTGTPETIRSLSPMPMVVNSPITITIHTTEPPSFPPSALGTSCSGCTDGAVAINNIVTNSNWNVQWTPTALAPFPETVSFKCPVEPATICPDRYCRLYPVRHYHGTGRPTAILLLQAGHTTGLLHQNQPWISHLH